MKNLQYTISVIDPCTHLLDVHLEIPVAANQTTLMIQMPVWTPGSYLVREYARHVRDFRCSMRGQSMAWYKVDKASWQMTLVGQAGVVDVHYRVYAYDLSVRTNHVDDSHAFFNPAAVCMQLPGYVGAIDVVTHMPATWQVATQLESTAEVQVQTGVSVARFVAEDYDALYDAPFECGTHRTEQFWYANALHEVVLWGSGNEDVPRLMRDIEQIVQSVAAQFAQVPYRRYVFILHLADGLYGGLEHRNSTVCLVDRWGFVREHDYERILGLIAHEFFHTWNVKRIRPAPLGPFDYQRENYTRQLWLVEGVTSYYDNLILCRSGLISPQRYLELITADIAIVQQAPGRHVQSLAEASFDAWIRYYRPDENSINVSVSYYVKGAVVVLALDMLIRRLSQGTRSFDDVLLALEARYPLHLPGIPEDDTMVQLIAEVGGIDREDVAEFFAAYIGGYAEVDYAELFATVGLEPRWMHSNDGAHGIGVNVRQDGTRLVVSSVLQDSPAMRAGIAPHDEIVALNQNRVDVSRWRARMAEQTVGTLVNVTFFRRDELRTVAVQVVANSPTALTLSSVAFPSGTQADEYRRWLKVAATT